VSGSFPDISLLGDTAGISDGDPLPGVAPVAKQHGTYVARCILADLKGKGMPAFRYRDHGSLATIGRKRASCKWDLLGISGFAAWPIWSRAPPHHRRLRLARGKHGREECAAG
jgi:NADH dehydrogenase